VKRELDVDRLDPDGVKDNSSALNVQASGTAAGSTTGINPNTNDFVPVWTRKPGNAQLPPQPSTGDVAFASSPLSWVWRPNSSLEHPSSPLASGLGLFGGVQVDVEFKTKVIKLVLYPYNNGRVQIDTVAILGFQVAQLNLTGQCPGVGQVNASAVGVFPPDTGLNKRPVQCSGHGKCSITGCECRGNWEGAACDRCAFGWDGDDCNTKVPIPELDGLSLCRIVMFEDLNDFTEDELTVRWDILEYTALTSRVFSSRHFGIKFVSPLLTLGQHTHVRVQAGFFITDVPNHRDSGIIVRAAAARSQFPARDRTRLEQIDDHENIVFVKHIPYQTGVNLMGVGKGDTSDQMDITTMWHHPDVSVEFEVWSPDIKEKVGKGDNRLTLTYFTVHACNYPSMRGADNPDPTPVF
jgi:hypothetical protein